jgi:hypothetical protein
MLTAGLILHFLLEMCAFAAVVAWGFQVGSNWGSKLLIGVGLPLLLAVLWGGFRDPADHGRGLVAIPGQLRLVLELGIMGLAAAALFAAGHTTLAWVFAAAVLIDYVLMYERVLFLLRIR